MGARSHLLLRQSGLRPSKHYRSYYKSAEREEESIATHYNMSERNGRAVYG